MKRKCNFFGWVVSDKDTYAWWSLLFLVSLKSLLLVLLLLILTMMIFDNIVILLILMTECYSAGLKLWIKVDIYDFE